MRDYESKHVATADFRQRPVEAVHSGEKADATGSAAVRPEASEHSAAGIGPTLSATTHRAMLKHATTARPSRAASVLLRLQRRFGNFHVQRVVNLARKGDGEAEVSPEMDKAIQRARGGGQAMDSGTRSRMEPAFGADFSGVRVHTDAQADVLSESLSARAFTTGKDIFFRQADYNPGSSSGRELIAHELTHVVQQNGAGVQPKLTVNKPGDRFEQEADQMSRAVMDAERRPAPEAESPGVAPRQAEEPVQARGENPALQRQPEAEEEDEMAGTQTESMEEEREAEE